MINDISGGDADSEMFSVVEKLNVPYIMMHMKGDPRLCRIILFMTMLLQIY